jgi:hypothetical protein
MKHPLLATAAAAALALAAAPASADGLHEGDIEITIVGGKLTLEGAAEFTFGTGWSIFEADFGDLGGGPLKTDDPGYDNEAGTFTPGTIVNYAAVGPLMVWNGSAWSTGGIAPEYVRLDGNFGEETRFTLTGVTGDATGLVGQAGGDGTIHEHLDMSIARTGGGLPTFGAYAITLKLTSAGLIDSDPYLIVLNHGLSDDAFEAGVHALAVPEPESWALMLGGLAAVGALARRRRT